MLRISIFVMIISFALAGAAQATCTRFPDAKSTAFDEVANKVSLPWRTDYPTAVPPTSHTWENTDFTSDWRAYINLVLDEVKASGIGIADNKIVMPQDAPWWISLWMDFTRNGREKLLGLTKERGPDRHDLAPGSRDDHQVWAIGWYNAEGARGLGEVFADPCNPSIPSRPDGRPWAFPDKSVSFKFLFTDASAPEVAYLEGSPQVKAMIDGPRGGRSEQVLRLIQVDVAVRDPDATKTNWVFGTFVWKGPKTGDGLFDNLEPVGLMWGNDPKKHEDDWSKLATLSQSQINPALDGMLWQRKNATDWPQRPYPGFQGRLNGPADNLRSSCLSCHALAQWRRHGELNLLPTYQLSAPPSADKIKQIVADYFQNVPGGTLTKPNSVPATALDYSLQLEASFYRICEACEAGALSGPTPGICQAPKQSPRDRLITRASCERPLISRTFKSFTDFVSNSIGWVDDEPPPRQ